MGFSRATRQDILSRYLGDGHYIGLSTTTPSDAGNAITNFSEPPASELRYARYPLEDSISIDVYAAEGNTPGGVMLKNTKNLYIGPLAASYTFTHFGIFSAASGGSPIYTGALTNAAGVPTPVTTSAGAVFTMEKEILADSLKAALRIMMADEG